MKRWAIVVVASLVLGNAGLASPQGKSQGRGRGEESGNGGQGGQAANKGDGVAVFGGVEIRIIREWFGNPTNLKGLPPGLAKKESLPPGLAKQLQRNGSLPPGLEKKIHPLPRDLEARLPRLPDGRKRVALGGIVILIDEKIGRILDVITDVF